MGAAVTAKIGQRHQGKPPLPPSTWRRYLKDLARVMLLVIAVMFTSALTVALIPKGVRYDCAIAEFHPDAPKAVKTECRNKRTTA